MKHISAAIIVLAGASVLIGGSLFSSDTQTFVMAVGCIIGGVGLWGWFDTLKEK